jgi:ring-1,2-phenylacetyl-CoA epoxidase subunit PaaC
MSDTAQPLLTYVLRQGDRSLVLAQRLLECVAYAPELEEDMALGNIALDLIGQARLLYTYAGEIEGEGNDEDHFAYWRSAGEFANPLLVEQPNGDFAHQITRQFLYDSFAAPFWAELATSSDESLAAIAAKAVKETAYHLRHSRGWVIRLGDGTDESQQRMQAAVDALWKFTDELFEHDAVEDALVATGVAPDPDSLKIHWQTTVESVLAEATLALPDSDSMRTGGRSGIHDERFSFLIGEMQVVTRAHPGASW